MDVPKSEVVRHFLRLEASRKEYKDSAAEIHSWCQASDDEVLVHARRFADSRHDTNPALAYTVGTREVDYSSGIAFWRRERINCAEVYTCGISTSMQPAINAVAGNMKDFALLFAPGFAGFSGLLTLPDGDEAVIIAIRQRRGGKNGEYELVDGAHRLVSLCQSGIETVEAYVGYLRTAGSG